MVGGCKARRLAHICSVRISVIVPAFNEERLISSTLAYIREAMAAVTERGWEHELIVCDNNSTDRTAELARAAGASIVFEPVNQIGRARNRGAQAATGEWLVFVDADSRPSKGLLVEVTEAIESGRYLGGGCTVQLDGDYPSGARLLQLWNLLSRTFHLLAGSFIFCEAEAFRAVGGFSHELFAGEELELSQKLKQLGRQQGRTLVILDRHPLVTSARKFQLYRKRDHVWFFLKSMLAPRRVLTDRAQCYLWYEGRR